MNPSKNAIYYLQNNPESSNIAIHFLHERSKINLNAMHVLFSYIDIIQEQKDEINGKSKYSDKKRRPTNKTAIQGE